MRRGLQDVSARAHAALLAPRGCRGTPAGFPLLDEVSAEYLVTCLVEEAETLTPDEVGAMCAPFLEDAGLDAGEVEACCARLVAALRMDGAEEAGEGEMSASSSANIRKAPTERGGLEESAGRSAWGEPPAEGAVAAERTVRATDWMAEVELDAAVQRVAVSRREDAPERLFERKDGRRAHAKGKRGGQGEQEGAISSECAPAASGVSHVVTSVSQASRFHNPTEMRDSTRAATGVDLRDVTMEVGGRELITSADVRLHPGRRYGMLGRNGCGKSCLLNQLAHGGFAALPRSLRVLLVSQSGRGELGGENDEGMSVLAMVINADAELGELRARERLLEPPECSDGDGVRGPSSSPQSSAPFDSAEIAAARRLARVLLLDAERDVDEFDKLSVARSRQRGKLMRVELVAAEARLEHAKAAAAEPEPEAVVEVYKDVRFHNNPDGWTALKDRGLTSVTEFHAEELLRVREALANMGGLEKAKADAMRILIGLGFSRDDLDAGKLVGEYSGGWQVRARLARALFASPDVLLLDEPTNHLDIEAVQWLESWILSDFDPTGQRVLLVISHDRVFLDAIATDIIVLEKQTLRYFVGSLSGFEASEEDTGRRRQQLVDSISRREQHMVQSVKHMLKKARESGDDKRLRQVASRKKKLEDRLGMEKANGRRFKLQRDLIGYHYARRVDIRGTVAEDTRLAGEHDTFKFVVGDALGYSGPVLTLDDCSLGYGEGPDVLLEITFDADMSSRIGILGFNGSGKSTLLHCLAGKLQPRTGLRTCWPSLKVAHYTQHLVEGVDPLLSPIEYFRARLASRAKESAMEVAHAELGGAGVDESERAIRQHLGGFGIKGKHATQALGSLSGGQQARTVLAYLAYLKPHLLLLDEVSNHLDLNSVDSLTVGLNDFGGGIILVSHDRSLLRSTCDDFYRCIDGRIVPCAPP